MMPRATCGPVYGLGRTASLRRAEGLSRRESLTLRAMCMSRDVSRTCVRMRAQTHESIWAHFLRCQWLTRKSAKAGESVRTYAKPYRGAAPALNDLLGGQIALIWALSVSVMPFVENGKVKALGVSTAQRFALLPQVPTVAESGVPGFDIGFFYGIAAPAKVPPQVVLRIGETVRAITELPDVRARMSAFGMSVDFRDAGQFRDLIAKEYAKYGAVACEAGIHPE